MSLPPPTTLVTAAGRLYVSAEELRRFIRAARAYERTDVGTFAATLAYTGCRISEALAVRAADVDLEQRTIRFRTLKRRVEHWREVPVPDAHVRELELVHQLRAVQRTRRSTQRLWPIGRSTASRHIDTLMQRAGIDGPQASAKGLRHGYAVAGVQAGIPLTTIGDVLGHASPTTTTIYGRTSGREARELVSRLWDDSFTSPGESTNGS